MGRSGRVDAVSFVDVVEPRPLSYDEPSLLPSEPRSDSATDL